MSSPITHLTGPGGRFEMTVEPVLGVPIPVMRHRGRSLGDTLTASAEFGERDYLITTERRITFAEHAAAAQALAAALQERYGITAGDRIGILAANTPEWVIVFWAAQSLGAIAVGYNAWWMPTEINYGIGHTEPAVLISDERRAARVAELGLSLPVLTMEHDVPALLAEYAGRTARPAEVAEDDPAVVLYTSGTSGLPKGVVHSHRNLLAVIDYHRFGDTLSDLFTGVDPAQAGVGPSSRRYLLTSPLFHIASLHNLVVPRLATGSAVVLYDGSFRADRVLRLIERERVTHWGAVPTMAQRLLAEDLSDYDLSSLTGFALASAPSSAALQEELRRHIPAAARALADSYGLTECSTAVAVATTPELIEFPGTLGMPIIGVDVEIRDEAGQPVPDGTEGEICVRSPYVMLGYWRDEAATAATLDQGRWLRTGDIGTRTNGRLRLTGRRSDLILRGGENIYPSEIELVLEEHPAVRECSVIGVADPDLGQAVGAVVVTEPNAVTQDELRAFLAQRLAYFKVPAVWRFTQTPLPRNATGKVLRRDVAV
ncbi:class I adenylate-forming enzyme family protein [Nocardia sp. CA-135398]|uniref:class I adenylate-forming enzyme family protein n=1 Tax=Nocardia sp. CA-135398 TaxID=3239977 RepID=UPI003D983F2E